MKRTAFAALSLLALTHCTTIAESNPSRTATEQMLISSAAERAAMNLALHLPPDATVFVDSSNFEGTDSKFAIASIRTSLLLRGAHLVDDRKNADIIVETRAGALSMDRKTYLIGIPQFNIPVPFASSPVPFPEIALYGTEDQKAVAKFAVTGYDAKKGGLVDAQEPQYGFSHKTKKTVFLFFSWTDSDYIPKDAEKNAPNNDSAAKASQTHLEYNQDGYAPAQSASSSSSSSSSPAPAVTAPPLAFPR